jgi:cell wall-associated NlpC family hydrolase
VHSQRTTTRRRPRVQILGSALGLAMVVTCSGLLTPSTAGATPADAAEASRLVQQAAQELTVIDEQVHEAEVTVAGLQDAADAAAGQAAAANAALAVYEPQLRAIAQSGYKGKTQTGVAAFLTSQSADDLVQQMLTLDMIAHYTNSVIGDVAAAQAVAAEAQAVADQAAAQAQAGLDQLEVQQAEVQKRVTEYEADFARLTAAEQAVVTAALAGPALRTPSTSSLPLAPSEAAGAAVRTGLGQVGDPYVWGSTGPDGFDCSGLTAYAYAAAGVSLPHSSAAQSRLGVEVARSDLQPGDLVFYYTPISHVALYIGNGMIVHARTFGQPVAVTSVDQRGYRFAKRITG